MTACASQSQIRTGFWEKALLENHLHCLSHHCRQEGWSEIRWWWCACCRGISQGNQRRHLHLEQQPSGWLLSSFLKLSTTTTPPSPSPGWMLQSFITFTVPTKSCSCYSKTNPAGAQNKKTPETEKNARQQMGSWAGFCLMDRLVRYASRLYCPVPRNSNVNESRRFSRLFQRKKCGLCWGVHKGKQKQSNCPQSGRWVDGQLVSQATSRKWRPERTGRKEMPPSQCWEMCNLALLGLCVPQND